MIIESIELENFRNYKSLNMSFDKNINILYGDNAQGKTNILEAIYLSGTTKSHRGNKDKELIKFGEEECHIRLKLNKNSTSYQIDMHIKNNKSKGIAINRIPIKKASELFGILNLVFFSPEDLNIIKNGPAERRKFLDITICQLDKIYLFNLSKYNKILNQRNKLLKDIDYNPGLIETLNVWDYQLCDCAKKIIEKRKEFIEKLSVIANSIHSNLTGNIENLNISYEPNTVIELFEKELEINRNKDLKQKSTSVGPHRDDILFSINDIDIRKYGSQGQQRTTALSLKLSEIELIKKNTNSMPVLLLDDVLSELDKNRQNYLLNSIDNIQTIITCTGLDDFVNNRFHIDKIYKIINGNVFNEN